MKRNIRKAAQTSPMEKTYFSGAYTPQYEIMGMGHHLTCPCHKAIAQEMTVAPIVSKHWRRATFLDWNQFRSVEPSYPDMAVHNNS